MLYDRDIREPLFDYLEDRFGKIKIIEEKTMGKTRADALMITEDSLIGIEIKSDADTYVRLERQVKDYDKFFDYNIVVVGTSHAAHIAEHVPEWWGIITVDEVDGSADFYEYRQMSLGSKKGKRKLKHQLQFLWREELAHIQEINGMYKYASKSKKFVQDKILEVVDWGELELQICEELMQRDYSGIAERIKKYKEKI